MKKIIIILAVILTSGLTALSVTKNENKTPVAKINVEKVSLGANTNNLATAD